MATWTEACPVEAVCTECGYSFDPADAIDPTRKRLPWLYEHARWWSVWAGVKTLAMLAWPPLFWKRVRPEHSVRAWRFAVVVLAPALLLVVVGALALLVDCIVAQRGQYWNWQGSGRPTWPAAASRGWGEFVRTIQDPSAMRWHVDESVSLGAAATVLVFFAAPVALAFVAMPSAWSGTKLRGAHLTRVAAYSCAPLLVALFVPTAWLLAVQVYSAVWHSQSHTVQPTWPRPWQIRVPDAVLTGAVLWWLLVWTPLYWLSALRRGYGLPRAWATWGILMAVHFTPVIVGIAFWGFTSLTDVWPSRRIY